MITRSLIAITAALSAAPLIAQTGDGAPPAGENALYCMRVEPATGSHLETVQCWTRAEWADADVSVDADWAENGVRVIG